MNKFLLKGFIVLLLGTYHACSYDKLDLPIPGEEIKTVSFTGDIHPIFQTYCYGNGNQRCHVSNTNQGASGDFTTYAGIKAKVDNNSIQSRMLNPAGGMPPSYSIGPKPVSEGEKDKVRNWIAAGAENN